jgi:chemotaxis protein MotB
LEATPESENQPQPRRGGKHKGHPAHGGAWKVAYADFVTAMLALFIVLWILSQDQPTKEAIQGYFRDPIGFTSSMGAAKFSASVGQTPPPTEQQIMAELERSLTSEVVRMQEIVKSNSELSSISDQIEIQVTDEGIRIEFRDNAHFNFFEVGSPNPSKQLVNLIQLLTPEIQKLDYPIAVEGHTDSRAYGGNGYTNWELSSDRANTIRRTMISGGLSPSKICAINAFADSQLYNAVDPLAPENRRVTILLKTPLAKLRQAAKDKFPIALTK